MKTPKPTPINLPYASNVASFAKDQGFNPGTSFLGSLFKKGAVGSSQQSVQAAKQVGAGMLK